MANTIQVNVRVEGLDELLKKMDKVKGGEFVKPALKVGGERLRDQAGKYPPSGDWNNPAELRWYERGYGPKWRTASGEIKGKKTSENLRKKWYVKPDKDSVLVGNNASYALYVHGEQQPKFHKDHGWKKLLETAVEQADEILKDIEAAFLQMWDRA